MAMWAYVFIKRPFGVRPVYIDYKVYIDDDSDKFETQPFSLIISGAMAICRLRILQILACGHSSMLVYCWI